MHEMKGRDLTCCVRAVTLLGLKPEEDWVAQLLYQVWLMHEANLLSGSP